MSRDEPRLPEIGRDSFSWRCAAAGAPAPAASSAAAATRGKRRATSGRTGPGRATGREPPRPSPRLSHGTTGRAPSPEGGGRRAYATCLGHVVDVSRTCREGGARRALAAPPAAWSPPPRSRLGLSARKPRGAVRTRRCTRTPNRSLPSCQQRALHSSVADERADTSFGSEETRMFSQLRELAAPVQLKEPN